jgi:V/A-type H+-transporting ATPase subunit I
MYIPMIMMGEKINNIFGTIAPNLLTGGLIMVFLFSSESKNIFKRIIDGLLGLTKISTAFGDVLSYLRIFALGLASASLGITFNQLSIQVIDAMPTLGYVMAFIILILGQAINFGLGIMSGVVHGLRLNVIEFFNWSISDEGYPFNAFKKMEVKKWIKL